VTPQSNRMKKFFMAAIAAALCGSPALATPPTAPMFNWSGFYAGLNAGAAWGREDETLVLTGLWPTQPEFTGIQAAGSQGMHPSGFTGGGQLGFNIQSGPAVFGIEADINSLRLRGHRFIPNVPNASANTYSLAATSETNWMATARGRAGFAIDRLLLFFTGGVAIIDDKFSQRLTQLNFAFSESGSASATKSVAIIGGGLEYALGNGWSFKGEYLYANLGALAFSSAGSAPFGAFTGDHSNKLKVEIVRAGINYRFSWGP
jgi:outer membrane immunogenic protein